MPVTNRMLMQRKEEGCIAITPEKKYYRVGDAFIKRSLRPHEWQTSPFRGTTHVPRQDRERALNEAACMLYIMQNSDIPVPKLHASFEDDGAVYLVMQYVDGVGMDSLEEVEKTTVRQELEKHLKTLSNLVSSRVGGPSGFIVPPYRVFDKSFRDDWSTAIHADGSSLDSRVRDQKDGKWKGEGKYVFCHNDLSQSNVMVDPETLEIAAIVDWEYAGFFPAFFERKFFERLGPSVALEGEEDDSGKLVEFLQSQRAG